LESGKEAGKGSSTKIGKAPGCDVLGTSTNLYVLRRVLRGRKAIREKNLVRPERFELPTYSSGGCRSIQLSYGRTPILTVYLLRRALSNGSAAFHFPKPLMSVA
jgi:hypothetical protein